MIIDAGEQVCFIERRHFTEDPIRYFVGQIIASSENSLRIKGHAWVYEMMKGLTRKPELRERLIYPNDRTNINIISKDIKIDELDFVNVSGKGLCLTDGKEFCLDLSEFGASK